MEKCKICGELFKRITNTHLKYKHEITRRQYDKLEGKEGTVTIKIDGMGEKRCRVCGKKYKRLTKNHLQSHGLTRKEYEELPPYGMDSAELKTVDSSGNEVKLQTGDMDRLVPTIKNMILGKGTLDEQARKTVHELFQSKEMEFKAIVTLLAMKRMNRISELLEAKTKSENILFEKLDNDELHALTVLRIFKALSKEIETSEDLFKDLSGMNPRFDLSTKNLINILSSEDLENPPVSIGEREQTKALIDGVVHILENAQVNDDNDS